MAKKQTRRSISVMGRTYARIVAAIRMGALEGSVSGYIEELVDSDMRARGVPVQEKPLPREPKREPPDPDGKVASGIFTW